jgi:hypothetical protein
MLIATKTSYVPSSINFIDQFSRRRRSKGSTKMNQNIRNKHPEMLGGLCDLGGQAEKEKIRLYQEVRKSDNLMSRLMKSYERKV